ncbi:MAG: ABC transporter substrate-binding protein [Desertimonas sp.]
MSPGRSRSLVTAGSAVVALGALGATVAASPPPVIAPGTTSADTTISGEPGFPRIIEVGDDTVAIDAKPQRIVALSTDVAEVALALAGPDRLVALPATNANPAVGALPDEASEVGYQLAHGESVDEAQLTAWDADLVLVSPNHAAERALSAELAGGDIPLIVMPNSWDDLDDVRTNVTLIGAALGADAMAGEMVEEITERESVVADRVAGLDGRPSVLILTNVAQVPFLIGPGTATHDLVTTAGGLDAAESLEVTVPISGIDADQIVAVDPDAILLVDGLGTGRAAFAALLAEPGVSELSVVTDNRILVLPARDTFGAAHTLVDGLEAIAEWLHPRAVNATTSTG